MCIRDRGNTDQTLVFFEMPRNKIVAPTGSKSKLAKTTGAEKLPSTVGLCITADETNFHPMSSSKGIPYQRNKYYHVQVHEKC